MAFRILQKDEQRLVRVPVMIPVPVDGGDVKKHQVQVTYMIPRQSVVDKLMARLRDGDELSELGDSYVARVDDVEEADGSPVRYASDRACAIEGHKDYDAKAAEIRNEVLEVTYARSAIMATFWKLLRGERIEARRGN